MTREEIIKEAIDYVQTGRFSYYHECYDEMCAVLKCFADTNAKYVNYKDTQWYLDEKKEKIYYERLFNQWEPKPTPWYEQSQNNLVCHSLL